MSLQRLTALRSLMASQPQAIAAYIIPTADAHNSEYIASVDARREWVSGFTGSAGTAVVTSSHALVWTDGRYYTQFDKQVDLTLWTLMKQSLSETPTMEKWLSAHLPEGSIVGADPYTMMGEEWTPLRMELSKSNIKLEAIKGNLVDQARTSLGDPPPARPAHPLVPLPLRYTGRSAGEKIAVLRKQMKDKKASALVISALDEVAYTLNLRGSDIQYNPVFFSYLVINQTSVHLFWNVGHLEPDVTSHLKSEGAEVTCHKYTDVEDFLEKMAKQLSETGDMKHAVWLSFQSSEAIHRAAAGGELVKQPLRLLSEISPVCLMKQIKNDVELKGFRDCHIRDGIAVVRLFKWLHDRIRDGAEITEVQASDQLLEFRKNEEDFVGPSFETIPGAGPNGAIIHYAPSRTGPQTIIRRDDMFLLDSGGQYKDGTTDITRTRHMGKPTAEQIEAFTRVLKGQIAIGSALFPKGVKGNVLDSLARAPLWAVGLDYAHGTGHGVGHHLLVHEGPGAVTWRAVPHDPGLQPRHVLSNEPGYYKVGSFGIRHEDLIIVIAVNKTTDHPRAATLQGDYDGRGVLGFETITMVPNQRECIDVNLLDDFELAYTNAYHKKVLDTLGPILKQRDLLEDLEWLKKECAPINRN